MVCTCIDVRYKSEGLCCTVPTHNKDIEVEGMYLEQNYVFIGKARLRQVTLSAITLILIISRVKGHDNHLDTGSQS